MDKATASEFRGSEFESRRRQSCDECFMCSYSAESFGWRLIMWNMQNQSEMSMYINENAVPREESF